MGAKRRVPGAMARSTAGVGRDTSRRAQHNRALGIQAAWEEDEAVETLLPTERRCRDCGRKYTVGTRYCPTCKALISGWIRWTRRIGWTVVVALMVVAFLNYRRLYPAKAKNADGGPPKSGVELLSHSLQREKHGDLMYVRGTVTNHSPVDMFYAKVEFELIDAIGNSLGMAEDNKSVISSNAVWGFKAMVLDPDAVSYRNPKLSAVR